MTSESHRTVSEATRRSILDALAIEKFPWWGRLSETQFLGRTFDLASLPSYDPRHDTADADIERHRVWNNDWEDDWLFHDDRFDLLRCPDAIFLKLLAEMAHPVVQTEDDRVRWLVDMCNHYLASNDWILSRTGDISGRPTFEAKRRGQPESGAAEMKSEEGSQDQERMEVEGILATLTDLFAYDGAAKEVAILAHGSAELRQTNYDNWNGGTYGYTLYIRIPTELYTQVYGERKALEDSISEKCKPFFTDNEYLETVSILPVQTADPKWRDKAKAWLAGSGVTNQGRVRSDNIASRECDGLLFRSQPEINLYKALKTAGVSFAPLPVFIRGGSSYRRIEPDFVIVKDGVVVVVEVDGDTVHRELPAEAHDRTTILEYEGVHILRVLASRCETAELASQYTQQLLTIIEKLKRSRH